jgi:exosome complex component RRP42
MGEYIIPTLQKERLVEYLKQGKRFDGRKTDEYRALEIETGISKNAESSVRVKLGKTEVYAGVKMAITEPYPDSPAEGTFMTTAELHPMASNDFDMGKPGIDSVELARIIDRGVRESGFIDFGKLCIKEGEKVWQIFLDIFAINDDGNLLDVAGIASLVALGNAKLPKYNEKENKIEHELSDKALPLNKDALSFNITLHKIGGELVVDVNREEEAISDYRISMAVGENDGSPRITAMQKGKAGSISAAEMEKAFNLIEIKFKEMFPIVKKQVFGK